MCGCIIGPWWKRRLSSTELPQGSVSWEREPYGFKCASELRRTVNQVVVTVLEQTAETPAEAMTVLVAHIHLPPLMSHFKNAFQALSSVPVNRPARLSDQGLEHNWRPHWLKQSGVHQFTCTRARSRVKYVSQFVVSWGSFYSRLWRQTSCFECSVFTAVVMRSGSSRAGLCCYIFPPRLPYIIKASGGQFRG